MKEIILLAIVIVAICYITNEVLGGAIMGLALVVMIYAAYIIYVHLWGYNLPWDTPPAFERADEKWEEYKEKNYEYREFNLYE